MNYIHVNDMLRTSIVSKMERRMRAIRLNESNIYDKKNGLVKPSVIQQNLRMVVRVKPPLQRNTKQILTNETY